MDIASPYFESLEKLHSSLVDAAWYDEKNEYLIIVLNGTAYHYCSVRSEIWDGLKSAPSLGRYYVANIKGRFDCRMFSAPEYPN